MRKNTVLSAIALFVFLPVSQNAFADDSAIGAMAEIRVLPLDSVYEL